MGTNEIQFDSLKGMTFATVEQVGTGTLVFTDVSGQRFTMYHDQDCCESVTIESIVGDLTDLVGAPILLAEEAVSDARPDGMPEPEYPPDSQTWTFYKLATIKGYVDIRWLGESNGWYSESVMLVRGDSLTWNDE